MKERKYTQVLFPFIIFLLIGASLNGTISTSTPTPKQTIHPECAEYDKDEDNDGYYGIISDIECQSYPYADGNGETVTNANNMGNNGPYQNYFDLSVDFTRYFISQECNNNLQGCINTNFITEVEFYCYFSENVMSSTWFDIFNGVFNQIAVLPDDGSANTYLNTCLTLNPVNTMPNNGDQYSSPIPDNPNGQAGGGVGGPK